MTAPVAFIVLAVGLPIFGLLFLRWAIHRAYMREARRLGIEPGDAIGTLRRRGGA